MTQLLRRSDETPPLGRWGQLFLASLKKNDPAQLAELEQMGELEKVARDVDETASAMYDQTLHALEAQNPSPKEQGARLQHLTKLQRQAEEIVTAELLVPNPEWKRQREEGYTDENTSTWSEEPLLPKPTAPRTLTRPTTSPNPPGSTPIE
jgi:ribonuclease D